MRPKALNILIREDYLKSWNNKKWCCRNDVFNSA